MTWISLGYHLSILRETQFCQTSVEVLRLEVRFVFAMSKQQDPPPPPPPPPAHPPPPPTKSTRKSCTTGLESHNDQGTFVTLKFVHATFVHVTN